MRNLSLLSVLFLLPLAAAAAEAPPRASVPGEAVIMAEPDRASLDMGAQARGTDLDAARHQVAAVIERVLDLTRSLGIPAEQVSTAAMDIRPDYEFDPRDQERRFLGYVVTRRIAVELHELDRLGPLVEGAIARGVNDVSSIRLSTSRERELEDRALVAAVHDARHRAALIAEALRVPLGEALEVTVQGGARPVLMQESFAMAKMAAPEETYQPGLIPVRVNVQAVFRLGAAQ